MVKKTNIDLMKEMVIKFVDLKYHLQVKYFLNYLKLIMVSCIYVYCLTMNL